MEMDLHTPNQNPTNPNIMSPPESDTDTDTPLLQTTHLTEALSLSLTNGSLKPHRQPPHAAVSYKECLKNHAAKLGGLALDGCGEFMPSPTATLPAPSSLNCAACGCHRNFHRRDPSSPTTTHLVPLTWAFPTPSSGPSSGGPASPTSPTTTTTSPTPLDHYYTYPSSSAGAHVFLGPTTGSSGGVKRSRTKFTQEQKTKMQAFAEKLGWKMLRGTSEKMVEEFCSEAGVKRNVFKVWMHNNKHRKDMGTANTAATFEINNASSSISEEGLDGYQVMERKVFGSSPTSS